MKNPFSNLVRTKARLRLNQTYRGQGSRFIAKGYVIFKQWDKTDGKNYYWEEWELTGFDNYDSWVEYDHYSKNITVYEPIRVPEKYDVLSLTKGMAVTMTINKLPVSGIVKEAGTGTVVKLRGKMSYQLFSDDVIHYAEVKTGPHSVISIEDYRQTGDTDFDYYSGRVLSKSEQKLLFGKTLAPLNFSWKVIIYGLGFFGYLASSFIPHYETTCTPRTTTQGTVSYNQSVGSATSKPTSSSAAVPNSVPQQDCRRVRVYGDGGSGVGK